MANRTDEEGEIPIGRFKESNRKQKSYTENSLNKQVGQYL
jgi:hypothetical protein